MSYVVVNNFKDALNYIEQTYTTLQSKLETVNKDVAEPMVFKTLSSDVKLGKYHQHFYPNNIQENINKCNSVEELNTLVDSWLMEIQQNIKLVDELIEYNKSVIKHHTKIHERIIDYMNSWNISKDAWVPDTKSRNRFPKKVRVDAGYISDLKRKFPIDPFINNQFMNYGESFKEYVKKYKEIKLQELRKIDEERFRIKQEKINNLVIAKLLLKYKLSEDSEKSDILYHIINQNKYLFLAHYLQLNRGDWNDGYCYAKIGLDNFKAENEEDKNIISEISKIINDYDNIDGRNFRDCSYSYEYLFNKVQAENLELYQDYQIIRNTLD